MEPETQKTHHIITLIPLLKMNGILPLQERVKLEEFGFSEFSNSGHEVTCPTINKSFGFVVDHKVESVVVRITNTTNILTGILITGPPGSGKTYFVNSVKERISDQYSFMNVDCADLILKEVGASEKKVYSIFETAKHQEPCIITLENLDIIFSNTELMGPLMRIQSSMLECMNAYALSRKRLCVLATATGSGKSLGRIFRRKGRLDLWIHLEPPTLVDVESMVRSFVASLGDEVSPDWLSKICNKFRDKQLGEIINTLKQAVYSAKLCALLRKPDQPEQPNILSIFLELDKMEVS